MSALDYGDPQRILALASSPRGDPPNLAIQLLGGFCIIVGTRVIDDTEWRLQKAGHLIKLLALSPRHRLSQEQMIDALWPGLDPAAARNNFHRTLYAARRTLDTDWGLAFLPLRHGTLFLESNGVLWIDIDAFAAATSAVRNCRNVELYHAAIAIYRGELLPDDRYVEIFADHREALRQFSSSSS